MPQIVSKLPPIKHQKNVDKTHRKDFLQYMNSLEKCLKHHFKIVACSNFRKKGPKINSIYGGNVTQTTDNLACRIADSQKRHNYDKRVVPYYL